MLHISIQTLFRPIYYSAFPAQYFCIFINVYVYLGGNVFECFPAIGKLRSAPLCICMIGLSKCIFIESNANSLRVHVSHTSMR